MRVARETGLFGRARGGKLGGGATGDRRAGDGAARLPRRWRGVGEAGAPRDQAAPDRPARRRRPAAARPARGHRPAAADQAHRRADDGEPLLRQLPGHAGRPGRGPAAGARRHPGRGQLHAERARLSRPPHGQHRRPGQEQPQPELAGQPHPVRRRAQRRLRRRRRRGAARRRPGRADGLLDRGRPALLLRAGADVPAGRPLVQLLPGPDVPEPQVPHLGHRPRAHGRPALGHRRLPGGRDDLRRAHRARHRTGSTTTTCGTTRCCAGCSAAAG